MIEQNLIGDISLLIKFKFRETISHVQQVNIRYFCRFRSYILQIFNYRIKKCKNKDLMVEMTIRKIKLNVKYQFTRKKYMFYLLPCIICCRINIKPLSSLQEDTHTHTLVHKLKDLLNNFYGSRLLNHIIATNSSVTWNCEITHGTKKKPN